MKKQLLAVAVAAAMAMVLVTASAYADTPRYQVVTLQYDAVGYFLGATGPYAQSFTLTLNPCDGTFSGPGFVPAPWNLPSVTTGSINGALISYTSTYDVEPGYTVTVNDAVLQADYSFIGVWSDNYSVGPRTNEPVLSGVPVVTQTEFRNHGDFVKQQPDKNDAAHSCIGMPIKSRK